MEAGDEGDGRGARRPEAVGHVEGSGQGADEGLGVGGDARDEDQCDERADTGASRHRVTQVVEARGRLLVVDPAAEDPGHERSDHPGGDHRGHSASQGGARGDDEDRGCQQDAQVEVMVAQGEDHHHDRQDRGEEGEGVERGEQASPWLGPGRYRGGLGQTDARVRCSGSGRPGQGDDVGAVLQGELEVVGGHDDRAPLVAQLVDEVHELAGVVPVLPVSGLVQDDDVALLADHGGH